MQLTDREWKEFKMIELFTDIRRGKRLVKDRQIPGSIPYVSSTAMNNGVDNFIALDAGEMRLYHQGLSIANSGSVGASFYEPFKYIASDHVTHLRNQHFDAWIYLFIATLTNRFSQKYNFNREINDLRISREKIVLPMDTHGNPDYAFMEDYIKELVQRKRQEYLDYVTRKLKQLEVTGGGGAIWLIRIGKQCI